MTAGALSKGRDAGRLRSLNPARDLAQVVALVEEAFAGEINPEGRKALKELKLVSRLGPLLWVLDRIDPEFHRYMQGFVWVEEGRVVGNVTVSCLDPYARRWQISNVAVEPAYRRRGIARRLMEAALDLARREGGEWALLRVRTDNAPALHLYQSLGFRQMATVAELQLPQVGEVTPLSLPHFALRPRSYGEWRKEYELATEAIPRELQWFYPLREERFFVPPDERLTRWLGDLLLGRRTYRLAVEKEGRFIATLTVKADPRREHTLDLMVHPSYRGRLERMLVSQALNILKGHPPGRVFISHPTAHREAIEALKEYGFSELRVLALMRLKL